MATWRSRPTGATISPRQRNNGNNKHDDNGNNNHNNNNHNNHHNWTSESLPAFEQRLLQTDTASSGNGGVGTASANGGVVSIGDINSGGNAGNAISVGDTHCPGAAPQKPSGGGGGNAAPSGGGGGKSGKVKALPNTGVGMVEDATSESLLLALGALGLVALSHGYGYQRRVSQAGGR